MYRPKSTLEQWRILQAVVDFGGYAQAANALNKSQSSLNHAVSKLQQQLNVQLLEVKGRKAYLTSAGEVMLRRSRILTQDISDLELLAENIQQGWEPELVIAVELAYPKSYLFNALTKFYPESRGSRITIIDTVLTGTEEIIHAGQADIVISSSVPKGYLSEPLCNVTFVPVVGKNHPLASLSEIDSKMLAQDLQIVIKDTATQPVEKSGWLKSEKRWTVTNFEHAISILKTGLGFCWLPEHVIATKCSLQELKVLTLDKGGMRHGHLSLVYPKETMIGPGCSMLVQLILQEHA
ncbi:LysR family transcriptional regulator [Flocculibacter collagenilyticus]|uniref:LysR family transcriptional regulator n=1 Tax=Flocculibacter collagenilyticus TaxID=2744479 RepID=UPI0018F332B0|nr:LysR substrate-binding domain-containing protein [Flocculibacter collagenilyticus]